MPREFNFLSLIGKESLKYANLPERYVKRVGEQVSFCIYTFALINNYIKQIYINAFIFYILFTFTQCNVFELFYFYSFLRLGFLHKSI